MKVLWKYMMKDICIIRTVMEEDWVVLSRSRGPPRNYDMRMGEFSLQTRWKSNWLMKVTPIQHYFLKGIPISRVFKYSPEAPGNKSEIFFRTFGFQTQDTYHTKGGHRDFSRYLSSQTQGIPPLLNIPWDHCLPPRSPSSFCRVSPPSLPQKSQSYTWRVCSEELESEFQGLRLEVGGSGTSE